MNLEQIYLQVDDYISSHPNSCARLGIDKRLGELPNPMLERSIADKAQAEMIYDRLADVDQETLDSLSFDERLDYELAKQLMRSCAVGLSLQIDGKHQEVKMPRAADEISGPLFGFFANDSRSSKMRIVNIISRLQKVPDYLVKAYQKLDRPVKRWVDMEIQKIDEIPGFLDVLLSWAKDESFPNVKAFEDAKKNAETALKQYRDKLSFISTSDNIHLDEGGVEMVLEMRGINLTASQIHRIAREEAIKNQAQVEELRVKLAKKYDFPADITSLELQEALNKKFQVERTGEGFQYILDRYQKEREDILAKIKENDLFPVFENQDLEIIQTPSFMEPSIPAGAMMSPPPFAKGVKKSIVYLTLSEELLAEHSEISIPTMMIHEGIPGHHLHLAWCANHKSKIRRYTSAMEQAEGWTTMLEDYMVDNGFAGDLEDEVRFVMKREFGRLAARVAIDLFFMSGDRTYLDIGVDFDKDSEDPFVLAGNLLKTMTGFVDARVQAELNWYSQERGYPLCYLTGNFLTWSLKDDFLKKVKALRPEMSELECDRLFHKTFLEAGSMPMAYMTRVFDNVVNHLS